ncbi:hypothetical protein ABB55_14460 [Prosthecomicrobium hirschii]|uniref:DUF112 domain-containing protein n=1 Tax=Prosthecodimorpha hirschii TaxID=665126 RepID=A0A0P6VN45_9HYPH|nr:hypothetical protein ABB55_14460 [Prosthecomicrobium hirschii]
MLLPITFRIDPMGALIMLAGIDYGSQNGGWTTAILLNIIGEGTVVVPSALPNCVLPVPGSA